MGEWAGWRQGSWVTSERKENVRTLFCLPGGWDNLNSCCARTILKTPPPSASSPEPETGDFLHVIYGMNKRMSVEPVVWILKPHLQAGL